MNFQAMEAEEGPAHLSLSPTFSNYSSGSGNLAEIAARVISETGGEPFSDSDDFGCESQGSVNRFRENFSDGDAKESAGGARRDNDVSDNGDGDDEFEFAVLCRESDASTISANEIFYNGQIKPFYPLFNMDLLLDNASRVETGLENFKKKKKPPLRRSPLGNLINEEKRQTTSLSLSEAKDLGAAPSDAYCIWSANTEKTSPGRCGKRNSTGSSNRWKLRDLLYSYSRGKCEGEGALAMRRTSAKKGDQSANVSKGKEGSKSGIGVASSTNSSSGLPSFLSQNARFWKNRAVKEIDKGRSYLPYR